VLSGGLTPYAKGPESIGKVKVVKKNAPSGEHKEGVGEPGTKPDFRKEKEGGEVKRNYFIVENAGNPKQHLKRSTLRGKKGGGGRGKFKRGREEGRVYWGQGSKNRGAQKKRELEGESRTTREGNGV